MNNRIYQCNEIYHCQNVNLSKLNVSHDLVIVETLQTTHDNFQSNDHQFHRARHIETTYLIFLNNYQKKSCTSNFMCQKKRSLLRTRQFTSFKKSIMFSFLISFSLNFQFSNFQFSISVQRFVDCFKYQIKNEIKHYFNFLYSRESID